MMAFKCVFWMSSILLIADVLEARTTGNPPDGIPKTSFSCRGRGSGYYADTETDCQAYHMCDEQGRQFDYMCPNATLFQQRMLICDHWYMVDCSSSEANYAFNRLIGQRDQHFVSQSDAEKRTPRPDLLDRPYAADYKGESYRAQIGKNKASAPQNALNAFVKNENRKYEILETQASSHVLPPQINENSLDPTSLPSSEEFPQVDKSNERRNAYSGETSDNGRVMRPPPTGFEPPKLLPSYNQEFRNREEARLKQLGLPVKPVQQLNRQPAKPATSVATFQQPKAKPVVAQTARPVAATNFQQSTKKPVVRTFDPEKNYKAFEHIFQPGKKATHKDYDFSRYFTKKEGAPTTAPAAQRRQSSPNTFNRQQPAVKTPAKQPATNSFNRQPVNAFKQQPAVTTTARPFVKTTTTKRAFISTAKPFVTKKPVQVVTTTRATTTTRRPITTTKQTPRLQSFNQIQQNNQRPSAPARVPAFNQPATLERDLLPPLDAQRNYEDGTTKGPAAYYPWKTPERGLLPPKLDTEDDEVQSKRSITEEGNFEGSNDFQSSESRRSGNRNSIKVEYKDLQKLFSIPEFEFPIESSGRDGYENAEAVNSFQVKIPYKNGKSERYYYLEHAHCNPECHPYFFKPGRCEPCIKL